MAKELEIKVKVDGQEIDVAKKSTQELTNQIAGLKDKLSQVPIGSADFKKIQGDINELEQGFRKAKDATQPFLESFGQLPGLLGYVGRSIQGVKEGFDLLAENPLIAIFTAAAFVIEKVVEKLDSMKAVSEALEKAMSIFGTVTDTIVNTVLKPLVEVVSSAIEGLAKMGTTVLSWVSGSEKAAESTEKYADQLRELNLQSGELAIKQAEATAKIAEAREVAQNANLPLKERIGALKDAKKYEDETAEASKRAATLKVQDELIKLNTSLGANKQIQAAIESGHKDQLRWAAEELLKNDEVNVKKVQGAQQTIASIYDIDSQAALRNRRLNTATQNLEKEDLKKGEEAAKASAEAKKEYEKKLAEFKNDLRLQGITDEKEKAMVSLEIDKQKTIAEINALKISQNQKNELIKAANADFAAKEKNLRDKQNQERLKDEKKLQDELVELSVQGIKDETTRLKAEEQIRYEKRRSTIVEEMLKLGKTTEEMNAGLELLEQEHQQKVNTIVENGAKKNAELVYKQIEFERQLRATELTNRLKQLDLQFIAEDKKIQERRKVEIEQAATNRDKELENLKKLHDAKQISDDDYFKASATQWEVYETNKLAIDIKTTQDLVKNQEVLATGMDALGKSIGQVADAFGKESDAGKALMEISQGLILVSQILTFTRQIQALTTMGAAEAEAVLKGSSLPFPGNLIAIATTVATFASIIGTIKSLTSGTGSSSSASKSNNGITSKQGYADGGMIYGPDHSQGGVNINAQGGEAVMTRGAVTMFAPLLSHLNQLGGGTSFSRTAVGQARMDNPKSTSPEAQTPIIKTYVVAQDMNAMNHKQERLKDLSTL